MDALPIVLRDLSRVGAESIGCDPAMVAVPGLATLAASVGGTRAVEVKPGWSEPCILWGAVIGESSARKSPGFDLATAPLFEVQRGYFREHDADTRRHREMKGEGCGRENPPICRRVVIDDATLDSVAPILRDNPRGVLVACEELDSWFQSFTRYAGGGATDQPRWLKLYGGRTLIVDRKGSGTISVPGAVASITGTIQPGVFSRAMTLQARESGLVARILLAMPPRLPRRWTDAHIPADVTTTYAAIVRALLAIPMECYDDGAPRAVRLPLSADAKALYVAFVNRIGAQADDSAEPDVRAVLGKLEGTAARLALVCVLARGDCDPAGMMFVDAEAMRDGIALAEWFASEVIRVYGLLSETGVERERREVVEYIRRKGGAIDARSLQRSYQKKYRKAEMARAELDGLVRAGLGLWDGVVFRLRSDSEAAG